MSLSLKAIELSNIRFHKHFIFEPAAEGLTSISGANGTGKSTIVESLGWCLYGSKPNGVPKNIALVREGVVPGGAAEKVFVRVDLNVSGRDIRIVRRFINKGGTVECEVYEKDKDGKWPTIAGPSVSHAEPYIRKLLHMDEKGFLAAILVQQKQVDQLISSGARERAEVIEKLTGIASISAALTEARKEHNSLKKTASLSQVDETALEKQKKELSALNAEIAEKSADLNKRQSDEKTLRELGIKLKKELEEAETIFSDAAEAKEKVAVLKATVETQESELSRITEEKTAKKAKLSNLGMGASLEDVSASIRELQKKSRALSEETYNCRKEIKRLSTEKAAHADVLSISKIKDISSAEKGLASYRKKQAGLETQVSSLRNTVAGVGSKVESIDNALFIIRDSQGECPTCLQKVKDVSSAVSSLEKEKESLLSEAAAVSKDVEDKMAEAEEARTTVEKFLLLIQSIRGNVQTEEEIKELEGRLTSSEADSKIVEDELTSANKVLRQLEAQEENKKAYQEVLLRAQTVSNHIETNKKLIIENQGKVKSTVTAREINSKKKRLDEERTKYLEAASQLTEGRGELKLWVERKKHLEEKVTAHEAEVKKHKELLKSVEVASNSASVIEEFRKNRIESSVPIIEGYASDLLSRFTEGKFVRLKIDNKFNTTVALADGRERATGLLSGGELSAAAMSLRLAISMLLNGGTSQSLIVLDEVLVSQDNSRAEMILSSIKEVSKGQVILIAHSDIVQDVADKIVSLV